MTAPLAPGEGGPPLTPEQKEQYKANLAAATKRWDDLAEEADRWEKAQFWAMWRERVRLAALIVLAAGVMLLGVSAMLYVSSIVDITAALVVAVSFVGIVGIVLSIVILSLLGRLARVLEPSDDPRGGIFG